MKDYWEKRYKDGGKIWGENPSLSAKQAGVLFESSRVESVLVPGCGYGRHTSYFDSLGFEVSGIEIASDAIETAKKDNPHIKYYKGSVLDMPFSADRYDAVYCFNVLHLFMDSDRKKFVSSCRDVLKDAGFVYFTVFSELEDSFGKGKMVEYNTYESKPGRPVHYFTHDDLLDHFKDFEVLDTGTIDEEENHGEAGHHVHAVRYIFARKR